MANKEIKFTEEELQELRELQTNYQQKVFDFGNLRVEKMLLIKRQADLEDREVEAEVFTPAPEPPSDTPTT